MEGEPFTTFKVFPAKSNWLLIKRESSEDSVFRCTNTCLFSAIGVVRSKESFSSLVANIP